MKLGNKIKQLRISKGITQEVLANELDISFQAISKWEQNKTTPDISLLPTLSSYFGVTIDELFTINNDTHLLRIENMLMSKKELTQADETYINNFLTGLLETDDADKGYSLLAQMYNHKAKSYHHKASEHAKKALELNPDEKMTHTALNESNHGFWADWNYHNHHELIVYYQDFVKRNPNNRRGILFLLDQLIETYRFEESEVLIQQLITVDNGYIVDLYKGIIEKKKGNLEEAMRFFDKMIVDEPNNWHVYASRADQYASIGMYQKAIEDNLKAYDLQPSPKYIDAFECNAQIYEIMNQPKQAINMYEHAVKTLKSEWYITFGETVDSIQRKINTLIKQL